MTHPRLSRLDADAAREEIDRSKEVLEAHRRPAAAQLLLPYGDHNDETKRIVREAGIRPRP